MRHIIDKMADAEAKENSGKEITVTVKTPKEKKEVKIDEDADVKKVNSGSSCEARKSDFIFVFAL